MSSHSDATELPPKSAPLPERLAAAMARAGYTSNRALAKKLGTDGSLVGKWLGGAIPSARHRAKLAEALDTPADYFQQGSRGDRLAVLEASAVTAEDLAPVLRVIELLARGRTTEALRVWSEEVGS